MDISLSLLIFNGLIGQQQQQELEKKKKLYEESAPPAVGGYGGGSVISISLSLSSNKRWSRDIHLVDRGDIHQGLFV